MTTRRRLPSFLVSLSGLVAAGCVLLLGSGCSLFPKPAPDPTRHYVLTGPTSAVVNDALPKGRLVVGLRAVQIAPYLDGKAMIVRRGDNEIDYRDYARWAEPVAVGINRMLVARLYASDKVARVFPQPYPFDVARDVDVAVSVLRCEGRIKPDGTAVVSFLCALEIVKVGEKSGGGVEVLHREVYEAPELPWVEGDYTALAANISQNVGKLADVILARLPAE